MTRADDAPPQRLTAEQERWVAAARAFRDEQDALLEAGRAMALAYWRAVEPRTDPGSWGMW